MPVGTEVGHGPDEIVLDGDPAPPQKTAQHPNFCPMSIVAKRLYCIRIPLGTDIGLSLGDIVLDGDPAPREMVRAAPLFGPCLLWPRSPISATAELLLPLIFAVLLVDLISKVHLQL